MVVGVQVERQTLRRVVVAVRTSSQNPTAARLISGGQFNRLLEVEEGATYRGRAHKTTRGVIPRIVASRGGATASSDYPFKLYIDDGKLCCVEGNHYWFDSYANSVDIETLSETGTNSWPINAASTVYVQRTYNGDGSATVTLVRTADSVNTVKSGQNNTVMRFVIGTCTDQGAITQRWLGGDIDESRVA